MSVVLTLKQLDETIRWINPNISALNTHTHAKIEVNSIISGQVLFHSTIFEGSLDTRVQLLLSRRRGERNLSETSSRHGDLDSTGALEASASQFLAPPTLSLYSLWLQFRGGNIFSKNFLQQF
jgi:hypothetical protein